MHFLDDETLKLVRWWEEELTGEDRIQLMGDYSWHGSAEERHQKLREMRTNFLKSKCERTKEES